MWSRFKNNESGNISLMFGFCSVMFCVFLGVAVDGARMVAAKTKLTAAVDAAALAGAAAAETGMGDRNEIIQSYLSTNISHFGDNVSLGEPIIVFDDESGTVIVEQPTRIDLKFSSFLGAESKPINVVGTATYLIDNIDPVSIAFALDVSGSMSLRTPEGVQKIETLKAATRGLFNAIEAGTEQPERLGQVLRTGMSAYNTELVSDYPMGWGWIGLESSVDALVADGGTNSTPALENAYTQLRNDRAIRSLQAGFDRSRLREFVIFMTDGNNNSPEFDETSTAICQDMKADGIEIFSVAFEAPEQGELLLLSCASPNETPAPGQADTSRCMNNGTNGNGNALGHCRRERSNFYYDAADAAAFREAFKRIGEKIVRTGVRLSR